MTTSDWVRAAIAVGVCSVMMWHTYNCRRTIDELSKSHLAILERFLNLIRMLGEDNNSRWHRTVELMIADQARHIDKGGEP
jgi:hypothetical protein